MRAGERGGVAGEAAVAVRSALLQVNSHIPLGIYGCPEQLV